jgi:hypothetical protein
MRPHFSLSQFERVMAESILLQRGTMQQSIPEERSSWCLATMKALPKFQPSTLQLLLKATAMSRSSAGAPALLSVNHYWVNSVLH